MLQASVVIFAALGYIGLLFAVASFGDRKRPAAQRRAPRPLIYSLSLAVYCTSWTFFGSVGLATTQGFDFLTIYLGPIILMTVGAPAFLRVVTLAKANNITSVADFIAARYGKDQGIAALVAVVAIIASVPYISLQLKAVSASLLVLLGHLAGNSTAGFNVMGDLSLFVAFTMAAFAALFGTRHADATEHQDGLMLAIATESLVKLAAFLAVGLFVTFLLFSGPAGLWDAAQANGATMPFARGLSLENWITMTVLSAGAFVLLPRQFHVAVVENKGVEEIRRARWLFPLYLILINLFVVPLALAGMTLFPGGTVDSDVYVLAVPLVAGAEGLALLAFIGGLSAATAMVIVESVALAIMISNDLVIPLLLRRGGVAADRARPDDMMGLLLSVRRAAIFLILFLAYLYHRTTGDVALAQIGLLSFAAIAQVGPAFAAALLWQRATTKGAFAGIIAGMALWAYTLLLPSLADSGLIASTTVDHGLFGLSLLRPTALLGLNAGVLAHGVTWSLGINTLVLIIVSFLTRPSRIEQVQAGLFTAPYGRPQPRPAFLRWRSAITVDEVVTTVGRYLGPERARMCFESFARSHGRDLDTRREADAATVRYAEHLLASVVGAASSRLVLSLLLKKRAVSTKAALKLLDDASAAIQYNRELLQSAIDHVRQGIAVFDRDLRLVCWNRQFGEMLDLPADCYAVGVPLADMLAHAPAVDGEPEAGAGRRNSARAVARRVALYAHPATDFSEQLAQRGAVIEARSDPMPDGGIAVSFTDITASVEAAQAMERANETLERRVRERTNALERMNTDLETARAEAEEANVSKTRFLAAASHDILQPLNAARLYVTSMVERSRGAEEQRLAGNVDASLEAVEEILSALLDISRLDSGALKPEFAPVRLAEVLKQLEIEFAPLAREKNLRLTVLPSSLAVRSDRRMLRRLLQNLISNAVKYTPRGRILVGCRRVRGRVRVEVYDTGMGIPAEQHKLVFQEFQRLDSGARQARGLGLGLSIVERIAKVLEHPIALRSQPGCGTVFTVEMPVAVSMPEEALPQPVPVRGGTPLDGLMILAIDNEPAILDGMEMLLTGWGCNIIKAETVADALDQVRVCKRSPDIVLVDYHLDGTHGIDAVMALRWKLGSMPAVLITADRTSTVREAAAAADMTVLNKPLKPAALRAVLTHLRVDRGAAE